MTSSPHISRDIIGWAHRKIEALEEQTRHGNAGYFNTIDLASFRDLVEQLESLLKVAEGLFQMIDRETWRATGGDDQQGHYEGDYRAAQIEEYLTSLRASNPASSPQAGDLLVMPHAPGDSVPVGWTVEGDKMWRRADGTEAGRALGGGE